VNRSESEPAVVLPFDYCRKLNKAFAEWSRQSEQQAVASSKAAEQERYRASYAKRHTPETGNDAA